MHRIVLLLLASISVSALAADEPPAKLSDVVKNYSADLSMPDTPGLSIVGLNSENVLRPTTPRKFGMAILQGRNDNGTAKQGFALDFAPMKIFDPRLTKTEYRNSPAVARPLWNTQVSLGVGQPLSDADKSTRIGLGLSSVLWRAEASDPYLNDAFGKCLDSALWVDIPDEMPSLDDDGAKPAEVAASAAGGAGNKAAKKPATKTLKQCRDDLEKVTWNASALMIGLATSKVSGRDAAVLPDATPKGYWVSYNYGFDGIKSLQESLQFTLSWRRLRQEIVTDPLDKTKFVSQDSRLYGLKLYARTEAANLYIEASRKRSMIVSRDIERANIFVFGAEKKVAENWWVTLAMGTKRGGTDGNPTYISTGLKFGYEDKPSLGGK